MSDDLPFTDAQKRVVTAAASASFQQTIQGAVALRIFAGEATGEDSAALLSHLIIAVIHELLFAAATSGLSVEGANAMIGKAVDSISHQEYEKWQK